MKLFAILALFLSLFTFTAPLAVAYDSSYHPSCRGAEKAKHANFCAQIEAGPLYSGDHSGPNACNPYSPYYEEPCDE